MNRPIPTYGEAKDRFLAGLCPRCSKKMEQRRKLKDFFCHKCHTNWNLQKVQQEFGGSLIAQKTEGEPRKILGVRIPSWLRLQKH